MSSPQVLREFSAVVSALHSPDSTQQQRKEADQWLQQWQRTQDAWRVSDSILRSTECPPETQHVAAVTLRSKILYDFVELPESSHQSLCHSLLSHIDRFKFASPFSVVRFLVYALADLSVHMAATWTNPIETLFTHFSSSADSLILVLCLTALAEESTNARVMVDPDIRQIHTITLQKNAATVWEKLETIKNEAVVSKRSHTFIKVLECCVEWLAYWENVAAVILHSTIIRDCFSLIHLDTIRAIQQSSGADVSLFGNAAGGVALASELSSAAINCLCEIFYKARDNDQAERIVFDHALKELGGPVKEYALHALEEEDWSTCYSVARLLEVGGAGIANLILCPPTNATTSSPDIQNFLHLIFLYSSLPFLPGVLERGERGVTTVVLGFWYDYLSEFRSFISSAADKQKQNHNLKGDKTEEVSSSTRCAIQQNVELVEQLLTVLLKLCEIPEEILSDTQNTTARQDLKEYQSFRLDVMGVISEAHYVITFEGLLERILMSLRMAVQRDPNSFVVQEAHLKVISHVLADQRSSRNTANSSLFDLLDTLGGFLTSTNASNLLEVLLRTAAVEVIGRACCSNWLRQKPELIQKTMEGLLFQSFSPPFLSTSTNGDLGSSQYLLKEKCEEIPADAAEAFRSICVSCAEEPPLQQLLDRLVQVVKNESSNESESMFINIVEGVSIVVHHVKDDEHFLRAVEEICNPIVSAIVQASSPSNTQHSPPSQSSGPPAAAGLSQSTASSTSSVSASPTLSRYLNRLGSVIKALYPLSSAARRERFGAFTVAQLWPLMEDIMKKYRDCKILIEKSDRVLKHAMRCCREKFVEVLPAFSLLLMENAKWKLFSTYLYAAEWIAAEYAHDFEYHDSLALLYNELSSRGLTTIDELCRTNSIAHNPEVIEDLFCLIMRYLNICPLIACSSPSLPVALELIYPLLYHEHHEVIPAVYGFLETVTVTIPGKRLLTAKECKADPSAAAALLQSTLMPLFMQHLPRLLAEFVKVLLSVPSTSIKLRIVSNIDCMLLECPKAVLESAVASALQVLPANVASDTLKRKYLKQILKSSDDLDAAVNDIVFRCKQVRLHSSSLDFGDTSRPSGS